MKGEEERGERRKEGREGGERGEEKKEGEGGERERREGEEERRVERGGDVARELRCHPDVTKHSFRACQPGKKCMDLGCPCNCLPTLYQPPRPLYTIPHPISSFL